MPDKQTTCNKTVEEAKLCQLKRKCIAKEIETQQKAKHKKRIREWNQTSKGKLQRWLMKVTTKIATLNTI